MKRILIFLSLYGFALALASALSLDRAFAQTPKSSTFQSDSEDGFDEEIEQQGNKTIRKVRRGKIRERKGGPAVGEIEEGEVDSIRRRQKSLSHTVLGFGPFGSSNIGDGKMLYGFMVGHHWEVASQAEILLDLLGAFNGDGSFVSGNLGMNFLPLTGAISPFIGGGFGFGAAKGNDESSSGFSGMVGAGVRFFRLSDVQMDISAVYSGIFANGSLGVFGGQIRILF